MQAIGELFTATRQAAPAAKSALADCRDTVGWATGSAFDP